ncbi:MAG: hypothetical protein ACRC7A_02640, partial [Acinetobacter junii]
MNNKLKEIAVRLQQILDQITLLQNEYQSLYQEKEKLISLEEKNKNYLSAEERLLLFSQRFIGRTDTFAY